MNEWVALAGYIAAGGVTDPDSMLLTAGTGTMVAVFDRITNEGLPLEIQIAKYMDNPVACMVLLKSVGAVH